MSSNHGLCNPDISTFAGSPAGPALAHCPLSSAPASCGLPPVSPASPVSGALTHRGASPTGGGCPLPQSDGSAPLFRSGQERPAAVSSGRERQSGNAVPVWDEPNLLLAARLPLLYNGKQRACKGRVPADWASCGVWPWGLGEDRREASGGYFCMENPGDAAPKPKMTLFFFGQTQKKPV